MLPLFVITALAEIAGCYLVYLWTRGRSPMLLVGAAMALGLFAWLLSFHPNASRAYGGVYVASALVWGRVVEQHTPSHPPVEADACCGDAGGDALRSRAT